MRFLTADEAESDGLLVAFPKLARLHALMTLGSHTGIWVVRETEALGLTSLRIVDKSEPLHLAGAAEDVGDLLLRQAW